MRRITVLLAGMGAPERAACANALHGQEDLRILANVVQDDALTAAAEHKPRIVLCSWRLATLGHYLLLERLRERCPSALCLLWTDDGLHEKEVITALAKGAHGFVHRNNLDRELAQAIRSVDAGQAWVPRKMLGAISERFFARSFC